MDALLRHPTLQPLLETHTRAAVTLLVRETLEAARRDTSAHPTGIDEIADRVLGEGNARWQIGPAPLINATGVVLHTNLGRAPISRAAAQAALAVATSYSALEFDLARGTRGSRLGHLGALLRDVTGAEDGIVVNNNAGGLVLALAALCRRREVIVSRGQAVEIGGGFRIPAIMRESGARLIEVGTTNRTRLDDYAGALSERTGAILRVHASNFKILGFTEQVDVVDLAHLASERGVTLIDDVGSGSLLDTRSYGLAHEPMVQESVQAGADLVLFSGDKLLGGPQAGLIVGRAALTARLRAHSLMRILRPDKITIAALGATLVHYLRGEHDQEIPVWRMIAARPDQMETRAGAWLAALGGSANWTIQAAVEQAESTIGGGSLPGETLPTYVLGLRPRSRPASSAASALAAALRGGQPPVVARIADDRVLLDPRTVLPEQDAILVERLRNVIGSR